MGCAGSSESKEDRAAMIEAIGREPREPVETGNAMKDALAMKKYKVELRAYNGRLAEYKEELAERKKKPKEPENALGSPPKKEAQAAPVVDKAAEAAKRAERAAKEAAEAAEAAERRRLREEEKKKNDPFLLQAAKEREARAEAKRIKDAEDEAKAQEMEEERMLLEAEAEATAKREAAKKALEDAAAKKAAEAEYKAAQEAETALDREMKRMFMRDESEEPPAPSPAAAAVPATPVAAATPAALLSTFGYTSPSGQWCFFAEPSGLWDDGAKCTDKPGGLTLTCSRTGHRPRPEHEFRCRLHDEQLSNAGERPTFPADVHDKMAMRRYKKDMDEWQPEWLDEDEDEPPPVDEEDQYPLHCPRCEAKTRQCGEEGVQFATALTIIQGATDWLPSSYGMSLNAPVPALERRFFTHTGTWGHCVKCKLVVQATIEHAP